MAERLSWDQLSFPHCAHRDCSLVREEGTVCKVNDCLRLNLDSQLQGAFPHGVPVPYPPSPQPSVAVPGGSPTTARLSHSGFITGVELGLGCHLSCLLTSSPLNMAEGLLEPSFPHMDSHLVNEGAISVFPKIIAYFTIS